MQPTLARSQSLTRSAGLLFGPLAAIATWWLCPSEWAGTSEHAHAAAMAGVAVLMVVWWLTEAVPAAVTALVPLVLLPALSIMPGKAVAPNYGDRQIFLFLGGLLLALGVEKHGLHRRVALRIVSLVGDSPRRMVLGIMLATAAISMWMSNTATAVLMLPIAMSLVRRAEEQQVDERLLRNFAISLLLGVAYGANLGGMSTLVGTPTNVAFRQLYEGLYEGEPAISFGGWMLLGVPLAVSILVVAWLVMVAVLFPISGRSVFGGQTVIANELAHLGRMSTPEWRMAVIFVTTALLWAFREPVDGWGWAPWLESYGLLSAAPGEGFYVDDSTVAIAMALVSFIVPAARWNGAPLLDWEATSRLPWGVLILFGGGLALAAGMQSTGLDDLWGGWLGRQLAGQSDLTVVSLTTVGMTGITELASNVSSVQMSMPLLAGAAPQVPCDPRLLMIPATMAASCGFMLPVGTPPNAVVFASGRIPMRKMALAGLVVDLVSIVLIVTFVLLLGEPIMGILPDGCPDWAQPR